MSTIQLDDGFFFGQAVFTTMKVVAGQPVWLDQHLDRLKASAEYLGFESHVSKDHVKDYLRVNGTVDAALKIVVSKGNVVITHRPDVYGLDMQEPVMVGFSPVVRHSSNDLLQHKTIMYEGNRRVLAEARKQDYFEAIFLNEKGSITEGTFTNIFLIRGDRLYTPVDTDGLLPGLMRQWLMDQFEVVEDSFIPSDLSQFDGAFLTNTLMGVTPVESLNDQVFQNLPVISKIHQEWVNSIAREE